jgi:hypothetical protein
MLCAVLVILLASFIFKATPMRQQVGEAPRLVLLVMPQPRAKPVQMETKQSIPGRLARQPKPQANHLASPQPETEPVRAPDAVASAHAFDTATWFSMARARADARGNDKALRGVSPVLSTVRPATRVEALGEAIAAAVSPDAETPMGPRTRYVDADGRVYTSITNYGKKECYMSAPLSRPDGRSDGPRRIRCPESSANWRKYN